MPKNVLITGNSSGLGLGLSRVYLDAGFHVYGLSRRGCPDALAALHDQQCDLGDTRRIAPALQALLAGVKELELVYLNAGIFGKLSRPAEFSHEQFARIMDINVWANKVILDWLFGQGVRVSQVIAISSGAPLFANPVWAGYAISKTALNRLMALYAKEYNTTHFTALAPGLVDTAMQDYLCDEALHSRDDYPVLEKFRKARGTHAMPSGRDAAQTIMNAVPRLRDYESGSYVDIRHLAPGGR